MQDFKMNKIVSVVIFLAVIAVLVFISFNKKVPVENKTQTGQVIENQMTDTNDIKGVKVTVLQEGTGASAKAGDTISMSYTGKLSDGTVFDSNIDPKFEHVQPFIFTLGAEQVIKGWDVGVDGMKVGEKRKLEISSDYAYGETGIGGVIPPNATLIFEVELLAIN